MVKKDIYLLDVLQAKSLTANYWRTNKLPQNDRWNDQLLQWLINEMTVNKMDGW